jgi:hypothetical protein
LGPNPGHLWLQVPVRNHILTEQASVLMSAWGSIFVFTRRNGNL